MDEFSDRLGRRIRRDFGPEEDLAREILARTCDSERTRAALVLLARGRMSRLEELARFAEWDERDVLAISPLAGADWRERLEEELDDRRWRWWGRPHRRHGRTGALLTALLVLGLLALLVGLPGLVVGQYLDESRRTATTAGQVTEVRQDRWWDRTHGPSCSYRYVVGEDELTGVDRCPTSAAPGDRVEVHYDPVEADSSHVWSRRPRAGLVVGLGAWAAGILVLGRHWWRTRRR